MASIDPKKIRCVVFDFGFTLSSDYYFKNGPAGFPQWHDVIQRHIFGEPAVINLWLKGELSTFDIAGIISKYLPMELPLIIAAMEKGCANLNFNPAVWDFAVAQKAARRKTALVTGNMDIFTKVVVPAHRLDCLFDVIVNSSDYRESRKEFLWPVAFEHLGNGIDYSTSLLIEDGENEPAKFRLLGGYAYRYSNDEEFLDWLAAIDWNND